LLLRACSGTIAVCPRLARVTAMAKVGTPVRW
jgi:hypothetical protein